MRKDLILATGGAVVLDAVSLGLASIPQTLTLAGYLMAPGTWMAVLLTNPHDVWFLAVTVGVNLVVYFLIVSVGLRLFHAAYGSVK